MIEIPIDINDGNQEFDITLDNVTYRFRLTYNSRADKWTLDILNSDGIELLTGICLTLGADFLAYYSQSTLPNGKLFLVNINDGTTEANETNLGVDVKLFYETI